MTLDNSAGRVILEWRVNPYVQDARAADRWVEIRRINDAGRKVGKFVQCSKFEGSWLLGYEKGDWVSDSVWLAEPMDMPQEKIIEKYRDLIGAMSDKVQWSVDNDLPWGHNG